MVHLTRSLDLPACTMRLLQERITRDAVKKTPQTWQEWAQYQRAVMGPILTATVFITERLGVPLVMSAGHEAALIDVMIGLQLADDLRDFAEDLERAYVKFPVEALDACGLSVDDLLARRWTPATGRLVRSAAERARVWLRPQEPTLRWSVPSALLTRAFTSVALAQLAQAERAGAALLAQKVALPSSARWRILLPIRAVAAVAWKLSPFTRPASTTSERRVPAEVPGRPAAPPAPALPPLPHASGARPPAYGPQCCPGMWPSSWTATAAGPPIVLCPAPKGTEQE